MRSSRYPPGPRNCRTLELLLGWETIRASAYEPRLAVTGMGEKAPCCCGSEVTRMTGKKPVDAMKLKNVSQKSSFTVPGHTVGLKEWKLPYDVLVRYLYQPGELDGGQRRRATDAIWCLQAYIWSLQACSCSDEKWSSCCLLPGRWPCSRFRPWRTACSPLWYAAASMPSTLTLDLDGVKEVLQLACRNVPRFLQDSVFYLRHAGRLVLTERQCCGSSFSFTLEAR